MFALCAAADGFEAFLGAGDGIETLRLGSFIPPLLEFISARFFVLGFLGVASLSTKTNSMSFFNCASGFLKRLKLIPIKARASVINQIKRTTAGCKAVEIANDFLNGITSGLLVTIDGNVYGSTFFSSSSSSIKLLLLIIDTLLFSLILPF